MSREVMPNNAVSNNGADMKEGVTQGAELPPLRVLPPMRRRKVIGDERLDNQRWFEYFVLGTCVLMWAFFIWWALGGSVPAA